MREVSATELAVNRHLEEAQQQITQLEERLNNLPQERGLNLNLRPDGGPFDVSRARQQVAIEKRIAQVKERTLKAIDQELEHASFEEKEHCEQAVGKWRYPNGIDPAKEKDLNASQTMLAQHLYEKRYPEPSIGETEKTLDQSQEYAYQLRYGNQKNETKLTAKDIKDLDQSQDFAFKLRYLDKSPDGGLPSIASRHNREGIEPEIG